MNIQKAFEVISARELTRRALWCAAYIASAAGASARGDTTVLTTCSNVADGAVDGYDKKFPEAK